MERATLLANDRYYVDLDSFLDDCSHDKSLILRTLRFIPPNPANISSLIFTIISAIRSLKRTSRLPEEIIAAADALNAVLKEAKPVCFEQGKIRYSLPQDVIEKYKLEMLEVEE